MSRISKASSDASAEFAITAILAEAPSLTDALPHLLQSVCEGFGWDLAEAWLVLPDAKLVQLRALWHKPDLDAELWKATCLGVSGRRGHGLVGRAWDQRKVQWSANVREDPLFTRIPLAQAMGFNAGCAVPLCSDDEVGGVMLLLSREARRLDEHVASRLAAVGEQIGQIVRAHAATTRSERFLNDLIDSAHDIISLFRMDGTIEYESLAVERILGYRIEERIGKNVFDYIHPDDIPVALDAFQKGLANVGSAQRVEVRARKRDGSWVWLETVGAIKLEKSGMMAVAVSRDMTSRPPRDASASTVGGPPPPPLRSALTEGELRVLRLLTRGLSNPEIAKALNLSPHTVKEYVSKVTHKLNARNRAQATAIATELGLV